MDSERPSPPANERQVQRPFYLVAAMVLLWILGFQGVVTGASVAMTLHEGTLPDAFAVARSSAGEPLEAFFPTLAAARLAVLGTMPQLAFPLAVARALLAATLVLASTSVLVGRPSARSFAFQAIGANALFAIAEYLVFRTARGAWVDIAARALAAVHDPGTPGANLDLTRAWCYWSERSRLFMYELGVSFLAAVALTRPRTKVYFAEAAAAAEGAEEDGG